MKSLYKATFSDMTPLEVSIILALFTLSIIGIVASSWAIATIL